MPVYHTALFAALIAFLNVYLAIKIIGHRRSKRVSVGDDGHASLAHASRAQANLLEYALPMGFMLLVMELLLIHSDRMTGIFGWVWIILAALFLIGRGLHAHGMLTTRTGPTRVIGMHLTLWTSLAAAVVTIALSVGL